MTEDGWSDAIPVPGQVNTNVPEGTSCLSPDGRYLFLTKCDAVDGLGSCDIYLSLISEGKLSKPRNLGKLVNSKSWDTQPSFSSDGRTLFFTSNRPGGKGKGDIYMTRIGDDGKWTTPVGLSINTKGKEQSPFIHPNGTKLYFSSDGYPG
jgi:Tol biopolymer transport system component